MLDGGEHVHGFETLATPGHASHHIAYLDESGCAFVGDVAGVRLVDDGPVLLPAPRPDIDLDQWWASVDAIEAWRPTTLALPHFGAVSDPETHFLAVREQLDTTRRLIEDGVTSEQYIDGAREELRGLSADLARRYELVVPLAQNYVGCDALGGPERRRVEKPIG